MKQLETLLERFVGLNVLIIGDVMLDEYIWGDVDRISPEAPVPVVDIHQRTWAPGGAANAAANIQSLGGRAMLCGATGADYQSEKLREQLQEHNVGIAGLTAVQGRPTTTKTRIIARGQQMVRVDSESRQPLPVDSENRLVEFIESAMKMYDACILSDYNKGVLSERLSQTAIQAALKAGKPVVVDPKGVDYKKYCNATVIKPNTSEVEEAIGRPVEGEADLLQAGQKILNVVGESALLVTRGADGMTLFQHGQIEQHIPTMARTVYDVTGAGDTVVSALAMALASGANLLDGAHLANHAAGVVVGKVGTATVSLDDLRLGKD
ncbi:MAG: D-glycero-beta-D-manno-heptose-7-phosphate kinase [Candidatus Hinthialibacter antarcticus]|nr:D-glycero-beta-D-manno-heptose-7-phosphate kinase [Candidatus Hinthialibacter antarcticus]